MTIKETVGLSLSVLLYVGMHFLSIGLFGSDYGIVGTITLFGSICGGIYLFIRPDIGSPISKPPSVRNRLDAAFLGSFVGWYIGMIIAGMAYGS